MWEDGKFVTSTRPQKINNSLDKSVTVWSAMTEPFPGYFILAGLKTDLSSLSLILFDSFSRSKRPISISVERATPREVELCSIHKFIELKKSRGRRVYLATSFHSSYQILLIDRRFLSLLLTGINSADGAVLSSVVLEREVFLGTTASKITHLTLNYS